MSDLSSFEGETRTFFWTRTSFLESRAQLQPRTADAYERSNPSRTTDCLTYLEINESPTLSKPRTDDVYVLHAQRYTSHGRFSNHGQPRMVEDTWSVRRTSPDQV